jgi:hypothetical protein
MDVVKNRSIMQVNRLGLLKRVAMIPVAAMLLSNPEAETIESRPLSFQFARIVSNRIVQTETQLSGRPTIEEIGKAAARGMNYVWQYLQEMTRTGTIRVVHGVDFGEE